jgi:hypothetical protein
MASVQQRRDPRNAEGKSLALTCAARFGKPLCLKVECWQFNYLRWKFVRMK